MTIDAPEGAQSPPAAPENPAKPLEAPESSWLRFCADYDVCLAVMSRDRSKELSERTNRLLAHTPYTLFYSDPNGGADYGKYRYNTVDQHEVPRDVAGYSPVCNYILRHVDQRILIIMDDDVKRIYWLGQPRAYRLPPAQFPQMLVNLVVNALDAKVTMFSISEIDIMRASPLSPFATRTMLQGLYGFIGRGIWYDERNIHKADYDICLQHLKHTRLVWKDMRYFASKDINYLRGGLQEFRSREREEAEVENLKKWWGSDVIDWGGHQGSGPRRRRPDGSKNPAKRTSTQRHLHVHI